METRIANVQEQPAQAAGFGMSIFSDPKSFETAQRMANTLASSTIVPKAYQGNIPNALIAIEMASRLNTSPMMIMQNLYVVNGMPAWSSQYIIAMINSSRKYRTELQFDLSGEGENAKCYAWVEDMRGNKLVGPTISMEMAKKEGWISRNGSKWQTMPEVMLRYRAASFFGRLYCPDMIMGIYSTDEAADVEQATPVMPNNIDLSFETEAAAAQLVDEPRITAEEPEF